MYQENDRPKRQKMVDRKDKSLKKLLERYRREGWLLFIEKSGYPTRIGFIERINDDSILLRNDRKKTIEWHIPFSDLKVFSAVNPREKDEPGPTKWLDDEEAIK